MTAHEVQRDTAGSPRRERQETLSNTLRVEDLGQHARPVQGIAQPSQRHRETALVVRVTPPVRVGDHGGHLVVGDVPVAPHPRGVPVTLEPVHGLSDCAHVAPVQGEL